VGGQGLDGGGVLGAPVDAVTPIKGSEAVCDAVKAPGANLSGNSLTVMAPKQDHPRMWSILHVLLV